EGGSPRGEPAYTQPALFALECALARLWQSWGVEPDVVIGHSVGEYAAACVAGVFSLEDGLELIAERGRLMQELPRAGEMAAVFAGEERVKAALAPYAEEVSVASVNGPEEVAISGASRAVQAVLETLKADGIVAHKLNVSHAFHSHLIEAMLDAFERAARGLECAAPRLKLISNLTGQLVEDRLDGAYWRKQARSAVKFSDGVETLRELGCRWFVEIGPHTTLLDLTK